jgi:serine/threonine protein kinase
MAKSSSLSLDKYLDMRPDKKLSEEEAAGIMFQICKGLSYLHGIGVAHRDIKLGNVLISESSLVQLIDFGFATMSGDTKLTSFCGTPCYMCPEILKKQPYIGYHADVWAAGILLYRLVCGTTPFKGKPKL